MKPSHIAYSIQRGIEKVIGTYPHSSNKTLERQHRHRQKHTPEPTVIPVDVPHPVLLEK
jgi:hypothetical protein